MERLAFWLGLSVALIPSWSSPRSTCRSGSASSGRRPPGRRFIDATADLDLFALRALARQPMHVLARVHDDPAGAWRASDPDVIAALADLELRECGLRPRAPLSAGSRPPLTAWRPAPGAGGSRGGRTPGRHRLGQRGAAHSAGAQRDGRAAEAAPRHPRAERPGRHGRLDDQVELGAGHLVVVPQRRVGREEEPADLVPVVPARARRRDARTRRSRSPRGGRGRAAGVGQTGQVGLGRLPQRGHARASRRPAAAVARVGRRTPRRPARG